MIRQVVGRLSHSALERDSALGLSPIVINDQRSTVMIVTCAHVGILYAPRLEVLYVQSSVIREIIAPRLRNLIIRDIPRRAGAPVGGRRYSWRSIIPLDLTSVRWMSIQSKVYHEPIDLSGMVNLESLRVMTAKVCGLSLLRNLRRLILIGVNKEVVSVPSLEFLYLLNSRIALLRLYGLQFLSIRDSHINVISKTNRENGLAYFGPAEQLPQWLRGHVRVSLLSCIGDFPNAVGVIIDTPYRPIPPRVEYVFTLDKIGGGNFKIIAGDQICEDLSEFPQLRTVIFRTRCSAGQGYEFIKTDNPLREFVMRVLEL